MELVDLFIEHLAADDVYAIIDSKFLIAQCVERHGTSLQHVCFCVFLHHITDLTQQRIQMLQDISTVFITRIKTGLYSITSNR